MKNVMNDMMSNEKIKSMFDTGKGNYVIMSTLQIGFFSIVNIILMLSVEPFSLSSLNFLLSAILSSSQALFIQAYYEKNIDIMNNGIFDYTTVFSFMLFIGTCIGLIIDKIVNGNIYFIILSLPNISLTFYILYKIIQGLFV